MAKIIEQQQGNNINNGPEIWILYEKRSATPTRVNTSFLRYLSNINNLFVLKKQRQSVHK